MNYPCRTCRWSLEAHVEAELKSVCGGCLSKSKGAVEFPEYAPSLTLKNKEVANEDL